LGQLIKAASNPLVVSAGTPNMLVAGVITAPSTHALTNISRS
jgi:hypothetical protein